MRSTEPLNRRVHDTLRLGCGSLPQTTDDLLRTKLCVLSQKGFQSGQFYYYILITFDNIDKSILSFSCLQRIISYFNKFSFFIESINRVTPIPPPHRLKNGNLRNSSSSRRVRFSPNRENNFSLYAPFIIV